MAGRVVSPQNRTTVSVDEQVPAVDQVRADLHNEHRAKTVPVIEEILLRGGTVVFEKRLHIRVEFPDGSA